MPPGIRPGELPPFHKLGEYVFQDLCRDLLAAEETVATCDNYGTRGQKQYGVDLLAYRRHGDGIEVAQCKAYASFGPAAIKKASDDFLEHWDQRWSTSNVKRFILFVGCALDQTQQQDALQQERRRFAALGVCYEPWSAATILNKLRSRPGIVASYCKPADYWVREICGQAPDLPSRLTDRSQQREIVSTLLEDQLEQLAARVSGEMGRQLDEVRERWREGRREEATTWIAGLRDDRTTWLVLAPDVKARLLRFEARLEFEQPGGIDRAKQLATDAANLAPGSEDAVLRALIA
jgi:hypothetical protein